MLHTIFQIAFTYRDSNEMGKAKPKLRPEVEFEFIDAKDAKHMIQNYVRKSQLKCCKDAEFMSDLHTPIYFTDKHYPDILEQIQG